MNVDSPNDRSSRHSAHTHTHIQTSRRKGMRERERDRETEREEGEGEREREREREGGRKGETGCEGRRRSSRACFSRKTRQRSDARSEHGATSTHCEYSTQLAQLEQPALGFAHHNPARSHRTILGGSNRCTTRLRQGCFGLVLFFYHHALCRTNL